MQNLNANAHEFFQALADPYRIRVVGLMLRAKTEVCLCELAESLGEPEYKLSRHIKVLRNVGIVTSVRDGKWIYHSLVKKSRHLRSVYEAILFFPNDAEEREDDLARFKRRVSLREDGRCRQSPRKRGLKSKSLETIL